MRPKITTSLLTCCLAAFAFLPAQANPILAPDPAVETRAVQALLKLKRRFLVNKEAGALSALARPLAELGRLDSALEVTALAQKLEPRQSQQDTRDAALVMAMQRALAFGKLPEAATLWLRLKTSSARVEGGLVLGQASLRRGDAQAARHIFLAVAALLDNRSDQLPQLAYLLGRCGDFSAAKQTFIRAEADLKALEPPPNFASLGDPGRYQLLSYYLFKAGYIDEWQRIIAGKSFDTGTSLYVPIIGAGHFDGRNDLMTLLISTSRLDLALRLARYDKRYRKIVGLVAVAVAFERRQHDHAQALLVLQEAEAVYRSALPPDDDIHNTARSRQYQDAMRAIDLAFGRRVLGDESGAQTWLAQALHVDDSPSALFYQTYLDSFPIFQAIEEHSGFTSLEVTQSSAQIAPSLTRILERQNGELFVFSLIEAQVKLKQNTFARANLELLEKYAFRELHRGIGSLDLPIWTASQYRKLGDTARAHKLVARLLVLVPPQASSRSENGFALLRYGFLREGKQLLGQWATPTYQIGAVAAAEALYAPHTFPAWIGQIKKPTQRLTALLGYTDQLTSSLYSQPNYEPILVQRRF